jgi:hypothetical protein
MTEENTTSQTFTDNSLVVEMGQEAQPPVPNNIVQGSKIKQKAVGSNALANANLNLHFDQKLFYDVALTQTAKYDENLLDTWNVKNLFGKVDPSGFAIYPSESFLKLFPTTKDDKEIWGLNFVVDLFEEMQLLMAAYVNKASSMFGAGHSAFMPLKVAKGWSSVEVEYHKWMTQVFDVFTSDYIRGRRKESIVDFKSFVKLFLEFIKGFSSDFVFTFSGYILSSDCSRLNSGLVIDLFDKRYDQDGYKFQKYFFDTNFEFYRYLTGVSGFAIDKNIPWRLHVNLNNPKVRDKYLARVVSTAYSPQKLYSTVFRHAFRQDIQLLRFHMATFYNNYVNLNPITEKPKLFGGPKSALLPYCGTQQKAVTMEQIFLDSEMAFIDGVLDPKSAYFKKYDDIFWLRMYIDIKVAEYGIKFRPGRRQKFIKDAIFYNNLKGLNASLAKVVLDLKYLRGVQLMKTAGLKGERKGTATPGALVSTPTVGSYGGGGSGGY